MIEEKGVDKPEKGHK